VASVTALMYAADMSMVMASSLAQRSGPSSSKKALSVLRVLAAVRPHDARGDVVDDPP